MVSGEAALRRLSGVEGEVSSHYRCRRMGASSAGAGKPARLARGGFLVARPRRRQHPVDRIEIVNPGHEHGYRAFFQPAQVAAVIELCRDCVARWSIAPQSVLAHSDVAPTRKRIPANSSVDQLLRRGLATGPSPLGRPAVASWRWGQRATRRGLSGAARSLRIFSGDHRNLRRSNAFQHVCLSEALPASRVDGIADMGTITTLHRC